VPARALRRPSFIAALVAAASLGLTACFGGGGAPADPGGGTSTPPPAPVACASVDAENAPLVIVEDGLGAPEITTVPADATPDEESAAVAEANADGDVVAVERDTPVSAAVQANDEYRPLQWALNNVPFEDAWTSPLGGTTGTDQVVAVVDTGVQQTQPDLVGQVLPGQFFLHSSDGTAFVGPGATTDPHGHGTHVAGIIGANANNGIGIAGGAPAVKILPVQVLCPNGKGSSSDVAEGIIWAVNNGANVINVSIGGGFSAAELTAVQHARDNNVVVVAAAGNDGLNGATSYPAAFSQVIAVGATTSANQRASFSTTGNYLDLAAPGSNILSTVPAPGGSCAPSGPYCYSSGTSMSSPYAAAAAALVRAAHPTLGAIDVCNQLIRTATDLGLPSLPGWDAHFGYGLINPLLAVGPQAPGLATCT